METQALSNVVAFTAPTANVRAPRWLAGSRPSLLRAADLEHATLPAITVVRAHGRQSLLADRPFVDLLIRKLKARGHHAILVLEIDPKGRATAVEELVARFLPDVEIALGPADGLEAVQRAMIKIGARQRRREPEHDERQPDSADPMGSIRKIIAATSDLRARSGRLSAKEVASVFGLSLSTLAALLGRKKQTLSKTPDASGSLQEELRPFERIARLRAVLTPEDFRAWLRIGNEDLDGLSPLEVIEQGRASVVAGLAEDMLAGRPA